VGSFCIAGLVFGELPRLQYSLADEIGFAALKPILLDSGVYSHLCEGQKTCKAQDTRLNLLFTVASSVTNVRLCPTPVEEEDSGAKKKELMVGVSITYGCCPGPSWA